MMNGWSGDGQEMPMQLFLFRKQQTTKSSQAKYSLPIKRTLGIFYLVFVTTRVILYIRNTLIRSSHMLTMCSGEDRRNTNLKNIVFVFLLIKVLAVNTIVWLGLIVSFIDIIVNLIMVSFMCLSRVRTYKWECLLENLKLIL